MNIAVDLDGVIWDIMGVFLELYNEKFETNIKVEEVDEWYYFPEEKFQAVYPDTLKRIDEYPFLDESINHYLFLLMGKNEVKILTHEGNTVDVMKKKLEALNIREGFEYLELIKQDTYNGDKLSEVFDIYIDDCPLLVDRMKEYPDRILLLYDQPWNQYCEESNNVFRVKGWKNIMEKIGEIENVI